MTKASSGDLLSCAAIDSVLCTLTMSHLRLNVANVAYPSVRRYALSLISTVAYRRVAAPMPAQKNATVVCP